MLTGWLILICLLVSQSSGHVFEMPKKCAVPWCQNYDNSSVSFHRFPRDPPLRNIWLSVCQKNINADGERICGAHFNEDEFKKPKIFTSTRPKRFLKNDAVPSLLPTLISHASKQKQNNSEISPGPIPLPRLISHASEQGQNYPKVPVERCAVAGCVNASFHQNQNCSFFHFPKTPDIRKQWIQKCNRKFKFNADKSRICSNHFKPDDYITNATVSRPETPKLRLKKDAVPSLNLNLSDSQGVSLVQTNLESESTQVQEEYASELFIPGPSKEAVSSLVEAKKPYQKSINPDFVDNRSKSLRGQSPICEMPQAISSVNEAKEDPTCVQKEVAHFNSILNKFQNLKSKLESCQKLVHSGPAENVLKNLQSESALLKVPLVIPEAVEPEENPSCIQEEENSTLLAHFSSVLNDFKDLKSKFDLIVEENKNLSEKNKESEKDRARLLQENHTLSKKLQASEIQRRNLTYKTNQKVIHLEGRTNELLQTNRNLMNRIKNLESQIKVLENASSSSQKKRLEKFHNDMKDALKHVFTPNQVDMILRKKKRPKKWAVEEVSVALTLRYLSRRCYLFLRDTLHYPLPGVSTLKKWASRIKVHSGLLKDVLRLMEIYGKKKSDFHKVTVLSYDEMKVRKMYEFSKKDDEVIGPNNYMQVAMARGLFDSWKQPIFVDFDTKMTKELLLDLIKELHKIGYIVMACVSDCGGGNQGLWSELAVDMDHFYFDHPITGERVYCFADNPHLLKLLRNWLLDTGFLIDGKEITKEPLVALVAENKTEINANYKLTPLHLDVARAQRQNVRLAAELLSHSTAKGLKQYLPGEDKELARLLGEFVQLVSNWFDLFNSYALNAKTPPKKPFGCDIDEQMAIINEMIDVVSKMLCIGKQSLQVFQKMIISSCRSLVELYKECEQKFNIIYLLTHRLNQDILENLYSQLRTSGGLNDRPSPLNALYRLRALLLGKNPGIIFQNPNSLEAPPEAKTEFVVKETLKEASIDFEGETEERSEEEIIISCDTEGSTSSKSSVSICDDMPFSEKDGMLYLAGALAKKHKDKFSYLGKHTKDCKPVLSGHDYALPSWIHHLSYGGLIDPSEKWFAEVLRMEKHFRKLHKDKFSFKKKIIEKTSAYISSKVASSNIDQSLVKSFCLSRVVIRIKYLNFKKEKKAANADAGKTKALKRGADEVDEASIKMAKKMRRIVT